MLAYQDHLAREAGEVCGSCGTRAEDWVDPGSGRPWREPAWVVEFDSCPGCEQLESAWSMQGEHPLLRARLRPARPEDFDDPDE